MGRTYLLLSFHVSVLHRRDKEFRHLFTFSINQRETPEESGKRELYLHSCSLLSLSSGGGWECDVAGVTEDDSNLVNGRNTVINTFTLTRIGM